MKIIVGIDISKASIEAFSSGKAKCFPNSKAGFGQLLKWVKRADLFVMEATGGYHVALADHLHEAGRAMNILTRPRPNPETAHRR